MSDPSWSSWTVQRDDTMTSGGVTGGTVVAPVSRSAPASSSAGVAGRTPRRVRLTLAKLDPWTALKVSFVYGVAGLVVLLIAASLLYALVDVMGVLSSLRNFLNEVDSTHSGGGIVKWLSFSRVFTVTLVLGAVNVVLLSALATMGAFIYNVSSNVVGGLEVTFVERG